MDDRCITYSPAYTLVPTYECFNRCAYCNFRQDPGAGDWLTLEAAALQLARLGSQGITEILILSGEVHPHSPQRSAWLQRVRDLGQLAIDHGFLPHTNVGPLSYEEMATLKSVNVSMGLMLEQVTPAWLSTVHRHAPSKQPQWRLQQLHWAGKLQIPFTTGLLVGLGESQHDWQDSLRAIACLQTTYGHIQEVILQPYSPGSRESLVGPGFDLASFPELVHLARQHLPPEIAIQIPPNLVSQPAMLLRCLEAGARDLGGIGPHDEVNPDYPHPEVAQLQQVLTAAGWHLQPRLPIYPQYESWLPPTLQTAIQRLPSRSDPLKRSARHQDSRDDPPAGALARNARTVSR
jgi:FO synthase subunit 1